MKKNTAVIRVHFPTGDQEYQVLRRTEPAHDPLRLAAWLNDVARDIRQTSKRIKHPFVPRLRRSPR